MMNPPFRYFLRVRYGECDAQKVVFNSRYGDYVELATTEFFRALGFGDALVDGRLDYQLVRQITQWRAPARFDDVLMAEVSTQHIGTTSFRLRVDIQHAGDGRHLADIDTTYVMVNDRLEKTPVPAEVRDALNQGAPGQSANHAGGPTTGPRD